MNEDSWNALKFFHEELLKSGMINEKKGHSFVERKESSEVYFFVEKVFVDEECTGFP